MYSVQSTSTLGRARRAMASGSLKERVGEHAPVAHLDAAVDRENEALAGRGRVLLRPSGTEPVMRVMAEAPTETEAQGAVDRLCEVVQGLAQA